MPQQEAAQRAGAASMIFSSWPARVRKEGREEGLTSQQASMRPRHSGSHQCGTSGAMLPTIRPATATASQCVHVTLLNFNNVAAANTVSDDILLICTGLAKYALHCAEWHCPHKH